MIKILHSADWHLDAPLIAGATDRSRRLREVMQSIPHRLAEACRREGCDLVLLSGDLFDGPYTADTLRLVQKALAEMAVPVFISPGNHDFVGQDSPWLRESWPDNVHIFTRPVIESVTLPALECCVYGAGYTGMDCHGLLQDFSPARAQRYEICVLHGDPTQSNSPYCPVTAPQAAASGVSYLALGHIHKAGAFRAGKTLCGWPGCPMGHGYDETGEKGYYLVTLGDTAEIRFVPLDVPRFYDLEIPVDTDLAGVLPPVATEDHYRITLTGAGDPPELSAIYAAFSHIPNLEVRDHTVPMTDIWGSAGSDSFEGMYFSLLQQALEGADAETQKRIRLAARISRQLLDGQEVVLP